MSWRKRGRGGGAKINTREILSVGWNTCCFRCCLAWDDENNSMRLIYIRYSHSTLEPSVPPSPFHSSAWHLNAAPPPLSDRVSQQTPSDFSLSLTAPWVVSVFVQMQAQSPDSGGGQTKKLSAYSTLSVSFSLSLSFALCDVCMYIWMCVCFLMWMCSCFYIFKSLCV